MKSVVIYDSLYGNTKMVAEAFAQALNADVLEVGKVAGVDLSLYDVVVVGSPTHGGRPTPAIQDWLTSWTVGSAVKHILCFDTRMNKKNVSWWLKLLMNTIGYAAEKMKAVIVQKGCASVLAEGFYVRDKEGPLEEGELRRVLHIVKALR